MWNEENEKRAKVEKKKKFILLNENFIAMQLLHTVRSLNCNVNSN